MSEQVGADSALPTMLEVMMEVPAGDIILNPAKLHAAIIARRNWHDHSSQLLTQWAEQIRLRMVEEMGSQRQAAETLGVGRRTVRPRGKQARPNGA